MPIRRYLLGAFMLVGISAIPVAADEPAILRNIAAFFATDDVARRVDLAHQIEQDPAYDRGRVHEWLHAAVQFEPRRPGDDTLAVRLTDGSTRRVALRIPPGYDHHRPSPLIYALHGAGGNGSQIIGYVARLLGERADDFVIAAPTGYEEVIIHHNYWPPTAEHPTIWKALRRYVHVDSDRIYVTGYSRGGHTTWTLAMLHADQFAGAMPLAGYFSTLYGDALWEPFRHNLANLPTVCIWGAGDKLNADGNESSAGGIAGMNRAFRQLVNDDEWSLPVTMVEDPAAGHSNVCPPADQVRRLFSRRREHSPQRCEHAFRHIYQAQCYWIEGHEWRGGQWDGRKRTVHLNPGETVMSDEDIKNAACRMYRGLLGYLTGTREGQFFDVGRKKVGVLTVWFHDDMIDWDQPVKLDVSHRTRFEGKLTPSLYVCLSQAARTGDLDRLRWAGLFFNGQRKTVPVTADTGFPTFAEMVAVGD